MKPLTKKVNDLIAVFPFGEFVVDKSHLAELGKKPQKPVAPTLTTKTPTKSEMLVYLSACEKHESDIASYIDALK